MSAAWTGRLLTDHFRRVAHEHADRVAIERPPSSQQLQRETRSYRELAASAYSMAHRLAPFVQADDLVALAFDRAHIDLYSAQLGVLFAGAAWVSFDLEHPDERLRISLRDAAPVRVLTTTQHAQRLRELVDDPKIVVVFDDLAHDEVNEPPEIAIAPNALAYVIYTSGSSGAPKGVMIEQHSIANLVRSDLERFRLSPNDRVAQGSSPIYDSSVEETWLALACGATLVIMDAETTRSGPDLVPWLNSERISVFCPPPTLLRATGCREPWVDLPNLRLLYVGGEALTLDVADTWGRGRWLENGYGPTECTVTVVRGRIEPGAEITIGEPVAGHEAWLLDQDLKPVPDGEPGELCLTGPGLARGYLHQAALTAERFPEHPEFGRLYRTGDLAVRRAGQLVCLGRIDDQVKIRGHRVELEEIDARLAEIAGLRAGAAFLQTNTAGTILSAWLVATDPESPPNLDDLRSALQEKLPVHMIPMRFGFTDHLPRTAGDKLNRRALPPVPSDTPVEGAEPCGEQEVRVAAAFAQSLSLATVPVDVDFFDLGGHSLAAAIAVSVLRDDAATATATVRDVYEHRTVRALAAALSERRPPEVSGPAPVLKRASAGAVWTVGLAQAAWLCVPIVASAVSFWWLTRSAAVGMLRGPGFMASLLLLPLLAWIAALLWAPLAVVLTVATKRLLIGRYRPGRYPAWSSFHLRHWIVLRMAAGIPWTLLEGTTFQATALRCLGARIGQRVHIHRGVNLLRGGWDLLDIGDDVTLSQESSLRLVDLDRAAFVVGAISIGAGSTLDIRAALGPNTVVESEAYLGPLSVVEAGGHLAQGTRYAGVAAKPVGPHKVAAAVVTPKTWAPFRLGLITLAARLILSYALWLPNVALLVGVTLAAGLSVNELADIMERAEFSGQWLPALAVVAAAMTIFHLILEAFLCRLLSPAPAQQLSRWSARYIPIWLATGLVDRASRWLSGTLVWPAWLRLAGMRLGRGCEISTIIDVVPRHIEIGAESFFADGIYLGGPQIERGVVTTAKTRLGQNTFLGNHVVIPAGSSLPDDLLLGVATIADPKKLRSGSAWFGQPAFELPKREIVAVDRNLTHEPGLVLYATRVFFEASRLAIPAGGIAVLFLWTWMARSGALIDILLATLGTTALLVGSVIAMKWLLLGRVKPGQHPLWSCWCGRWDLLFMVWGNFARPVLASLELSPWLPWFLRAMGCRIGRRTVLGSGFAQVVDPDMIQIGDDATVNGLFQAHSFEDRVLKIDRVLIQQEATVGAGSILMYGADIGRGATVSPHSVVMKRERLPAFGTYRGCPTESVTS